MLILKTKNAVTTAGIMFLFSAVQTKSFAQPTVTSLIGEIVDAHGATATVSGHNSADYENLVTVSTTQNHQFIDWQEMSIGADTELHFDQPSTAAVVVNSVLGSQATEIAGKMSGDGYLFVLNPNGVLITETGIVDAAGFVATTAGKATFKDEAVASELVRFDFSSDGRTVDGAVVENQGEIRIDSNNSLYLVGPEVIQNGKVTATPDPYDIVENGGSGGGFSGNNEFVALPMIKTTGPDLGLGVNTTLSNANEFTLTYVKGASTDGTYPGSQITPREIAFSPTGRNPTRFSTTPTWSQENVKAEPSITIGSDASIEGGLGIYTRGEIDFQSDTFLGSHDGELRIITDTIELTQNISNVIEQRLADGGDVNIFAQQVNMSQTMDIPSETNAGQLTFSHIENSEILGIPTDPTLKSGVTVTRDQDTDQIDAVGIEVGVQKLHTFREGDGDLESAFVNWTSDAANGSFVRTVNTGDNKNIWIDWTQFDIAPGETTKFIQPDDRSVAINQVTGTQQSQIDGNLLANGQVFLLNPNGVIISESGLVDVAGFVGSTTTMSDPLGNLGGSGLVRNEYVLDQATLQENAGFSSKGNITVDSEGGLYLNAPRLNISGRIDDGVSDGLSRNFRWLSTNQGRVGLSTSGDANLSNVGYIHTIGRVNSADTEQTSLIVSNLDTDSDITLETNSDWRMQNVRFANPNSTVFISNKSYVDSKMSLSTTQANDLTKILEDGSGVLLSGHDVNIKHDLGSDLSTGRITFSGDNINISSTVQANSVSLQNFDEVNLEQGGSIMADAEVTIHSNMLRIDGELAARYIQFWDNDSDSTAIISNSGRVVAWSEQPFSFNPSSRKGYLSMDVGNLVIDGTIVTNSHLSLGRVQPHPPPYRPVIETQSVRLGADSLIQAGALYLANVVQEPMELNARIETKSLFLEGAFVQGADSILSSGINLDLDDNGEIDDNIVVGGKDFGENHFVGETNSGIDLIVAPNGSIIDLSAGENQIGSLLFAKAGKHQIDDNASSSQGDSAQNFSFDDSIQTQSAKVYINSVNQSGIGIGGDIADSYVAATFAPSSLVNDLEQYVVTNDFQGEELIVRASQIRIGAVKDQFGTVNEQAQSGAIKFDKVAFITDKLTTDKTNVLVSSADGSSEASGATILNPFILTSFTPGGTVQVVDNPGTIAHSDLKGQLLDNIQSIVAQGSNFGASVSTLPLASSLAFVSSTLGDDQSSHFTTFDLSIGNPGRIRSTDVGFDIDLEESFGDLAVKDVKLIALNKNDQDFSDQFTVVFDGNKLKVSSLGSQLDHAEFLTVRFEVESDVPSKNMSIGNLQARATASIGGQQISDLSNDEIAAFSVFTDGELDGEVDGYNDIQLLGELEGFTTANLVGFDPDEPVSVPPSNDSVDPKEPDIVRIIAQAENNLENDIVFFEPVQAETPSVFELVDFTQFDSDAFFSGFGNVQEMRRMYLRSDLVRSIKSATQQ